MKVTDKQLKLWLFLLLVGGTVVGIASTTPNTEQQQRQEQLDATPSCRTDWHLCKDNLDILVRYDEDKVWHMKSECKRETNKLVKFGDPQWTWDYFAATNHGTDAVEYGVMTLIDTDVKLQNQFGTYGHAKVVCGVNLATGKVLSVNAYNEQSQ
jgi:hypothetical protein